MVTDRSTGVLVMAYGTASGPDDIERYYTDIRGGRTPTPEHLEELRGRYAAIGNRFPLLDDHRRAGRRHRRTPERRRRRHLPRLSRDEAFLADDPRRRRADGRRRGRRGGRHRDGAPLVRHVGGDLRRSGPKPRSVTVGSNCRSPSCGRSTTTRCTWTGSRSGCVRRSRRWTMPRAPARRCCSPRTPCRCVCWPTARSDARPATAIRRAATGTACRRRRTSSRSEVGLDDHRIAWQSVGRTADPWWGPGIDEMIPALADERRTAVVVCCVGFVADHLETLYDLDIEATAEAAAAGLAFARTPMPNDDPAFCDCSPRSCASTSRGSLHEARSPGT